MIEVKLRYVHQCSFIRSPSTNYDIWAKEAKQRGWAELRSGEAVALVSRAGNQIAFVYKPIHVEHAGKQVRVTTHARVRLHSMAVLTPALLQMAAEEAGLSLRGFKNFQDYYKKLT